MRTAVLCENTALSEKYACEHGLSLYIETGSHKILFDTGQTDVFVKNAHLMDIDLTLADTVIISHGHYDHGGGLKKLLDINRHAAVYINEHAFEPHYNGTNKYNGLDISLKDSERLTFTGDFLKIDDELTLLTLNGLPRPYSFGSFGLNTEQGGKLIPDDFMHEQYLIIKENAKSVLVSGCSHKGILNIMSMLTTPPDAVIGGFHFMKLDTEDDRHELDLAARVLNAYNTLYYTCHCTGEKQYAYLFERMPRLRYICSGQRVEI